MLKKDHIIFGILIGLVIPVLFYALILLINFILVNAKVVEIYLNKEAHVLLGITGNLIPIRYYFVNLKLDKTGRGLLLVTFILIILFFSLKGRML
jgi:hypothetical protein